MHEETPPRGRPRESARRVILLAKDDQLRSLTITTTGRGATVHVYRRGSTEPAARHDFAEGRLAGWLRGALAAAAKAKWNVVYDGPAGGDDRPNPFRAVGDEMLAALHFGDPPPEDDARRTVILARGRLLASVTIAATPDGPTLTHSLNNILDAGELHATPPDPQADAGTARENAARVLAGLRRAGWVSFYDGRPLHG